MSCSNKKCFSQTHFDFRNFIVLLLETNAKSNGLSSIEGCQQIRKGLYTAFQTERQGYISLKVGRRNSISRGQAVKDDDTAFESLQMHEVLIVRHLIGLIKIFIVILLKNVYHIL